MRTKALLVACAVALAGTQVMAQSKDAPKDAKKPSTTPAKTTLQKPKKLNVTVGECTGAQCDIAVTVDANCKISLDFDMVKVKMKGAVVLKWTVAGGAFAANNGIVFASPGSVINCAQQPAGTTWQCTDTNQVPGIFKYAVNVTKAGGGACPTLDPEIINEP